MLSRYKIIIVNNNIGSAGVNLLTKTRMEKIKKIFLSNFIYFIKINAR